MKVNEVRSRLACSESFPQDAAENLGGTIRPSRMMSFGTGSEASQYRHGLTACPVQVFRPFEHEQRPAFADEKAIAAGGPGANPGFGRFVLVNRRCQGPHAPKRGFDHWNERCVGRPGDRDVADSLLEHFGCGPQTRQPRGTGRDRSGNRPCRSDAGGDVKRACRRAGCRPAEFAGQRIAGHRARIRRPAGLHPDGAFAQTDDDRDARGVDQGLFEPSLRESFAQGLFEDRKDQVVPHADSGQTSGIDRKTRQSAGWGIGVTAVPDDTRRASERSFTEVFEGLRKARSERRDQANPADRDGKAVPGDRLPACSFSVRWRAHELPSGACDRSRLLCLSRPTGAD